MYRISTHSCSGLIPHAGWKSNVFKQLGLLILLFTGFVLDAQTINSTSKNQSLAEDLFVYSRANQTTDSARYYVRSSIGEPWTQTNQYSNVGIMNSVFGLDAWTQAYFESANVEQMFSDQSSLVFMDGGDDGASVFQEFLNEHKALIEDWVENGGRLFLNAAPNVGGNINLGFDNTILNYGPDFITDVVLEDLDHWLFNGPAQPIQSNYFGDFFAHAFISGTHLNTILRDTVDWNRAVLAEKSWGEGLVLFGGMTSTQWHLPLTEALNMKKNILHHLEDYQFCDMELVCPDDLTVELDGSCCYTNVYYDEPYTVGDCESSIVQVLGFDSGADFEVGITQNMFQTLSVQGDTFTCNFDVMVLDPNDTLGVGKYYSANGEVFTEIGQKIQGAEMSINEGYLNTVTDVAGAYNFDSQILEGSTVNIDIDYEDYLTNGVTTFDITLITKHILGIEVLDSPYKIIAADVNNSKSITTLDIIYIRKAILHQIDEFPGKDSWVFVPDDESITLDNPWSYSEVIFYNDIQADLEVNFIAIKSGDVSDSVNVTE